MDKYISPKEFSDFKKNQDKLITILNHNMTKVSTDVGWLKKIMGWQIGLITTITIAVVSAFIKLVL